MEHLLHWSRNAKFVFPHCGHAQSPGRPGPGIPPRYTGTSTAPFLTAAAAAGEGTPACHLAPAPVSTLGAGLIGGGSLDRRGVVNDDGAPP